MRGLGRTPPDVALAEAAGRQWGVVALAQLEAVGIGRSGVTRRVQGVSLDAPDHPGLEVDCYFPTHRLVVKTTPTPSPTG